jgi:hypothetical protein
METSELIKVALAGAAFVFWLYRKLSEGVATAAPSTMAAPPPLPRRVRRSRPGVKSSAKESASEAGDSAPASVAPRHLDASNLRVTRPAVARVREEFRGLAALRRAVIAREVLGPPLSLRSPRR